jgi:exopolysaccharide biosynthesis WecB/TagA/CpsF family protein
MVAAAEVDLLRARGVEVVTAKFDNEERGAATVVRLGMNAAWSRDSYRKVVELCRRHRPDLAHVHNFWMALSPSVHAACHAAGVPTVQTIHNFRLLCANALLLRDGKHCEDCVGKPPWRGVVRRCYRESFVASAAVAHMIASNRARGTWQTGVDAFIALSEYSRSKLIAGGLPAERIFVKPNFAADPGEALGSPSAARTVVFAGRLSPEKGVAHLLRAWAAAKLSDAGRLLIVGDGPERSALEAMCVPGVVFCGRCPPSEAMAMMACARAVVLPSLSCENFPRSVVEAFSWGRAAIASSSGALAEIVDAGRTGLTYPAGDDEQLGAALQIVLASGGLADRLGRNARQEYLARYTPERNYEGLMQIYQSAIESRKYIYAPQSSGTQSACAAKQPVLGVGINPTSYGAVLRQVREWIGAGAGRYICAVEVHGIMTAQRDRSVRDNLNHADLATPDGMPVVWALRSFGFAGQRRVYGPNLMLALCGQAARLGHRVFLYGGTEETLPLLRRKLAARFPDLRIVGMWAPPFRQLTAEEDATATSMIRDSGADLVFVGIGTPKQDRWMEAHRARLPGVVMVGVGAAFNFHAGQVRQAPEWMQRAGLEWLFRLAAEPRRLWKRYLLVTPLFLPMWAMQKMGILKYPQPGRHS